MDAGVFVHASLHVHRCMCRCVSLIKSPLVWGCICQPLPPLWSFELAALSERASLISSSLCNQCPTGIQHFPRPCLPACLPYGSTDLMSRQLEALRVINADRQLQRKRRCEWVLKRFWRSTKEGLCNLFYTYSCLMYYQVCALVACLDFKKKDNNNIYFKECTGALVALKYLLRATKTCWDMTNPGTHA